MQYWCRLFEALQHEFPLTCALVGAWTFNQLAEGFLTATPPRGHDLARVADGFDAWLAATLPRDGVAPPHGDARPRAALLEAAAIDQAFRVVFAQPPAPLVRLAREGLARARLVRSPAAVVVVERWPLVALRHGQRPAPEAAVALPPPHAAGPQAWLIAAVADGQRVSPLSPLEVALVDRLAALPVAAALAEVERAHPADSPAALAACSGNNSCAGFSYGDWDPGLTTYHTCAGLNGCNSISWVVLPADSGKTGQQIYEEDLPETGPRSCINCHAEWSDTGPDMTKFKLWLPPGSTSCTRAPRSSASSTTSARS